MCALLFVAGLHVSVGRSAAPEVVQTARSILKGRPTLTYALTEQEPSSSCGAQRASRVTPPDTLSMTRKNNLP